MPRFLTVRPVPPPSPAVEGIRRLANFNLWANNTLAQCLNKKVNDDQLGADAGLYFRSIHGTINHLVAADALWQHRVSNGLRKLHGQEVDVKPASVETPAGPLPLSPLWRGTVAQWEQLFPDGRDALNRLLAGSQKWIELVGTIDGEKDLNAPLVYHDTSGKEARLPDLAAALTHAFNHATHHRGQISAAVTSLAGPSAVPVMDMLYFLLPPITNGKANAKKRVQRIPCGSEYT